MVILVMGVTGAGKTTVGQLLAQRLEWVFLDADSFHSPENIDKMRRGIALTDADREPWLAAIHEELVARAAQNQNVVLGCSASKQSYRNTLAAGLDFRICYLKGTYEQVKARLATRTGHFAGEAILAAQFSDLEEPTQSIQLCLADGPEKIVETALQKLNLKPVDESN